jgi:hypothetical protein
MAAWILKNSPPAAETVNSAAAAACRIRATRNNANAPPAAIREIVFTHITRGTGSGRGLPVRDPGSLVEKNRVGGY